MIVIGCSGVNSISNTVITLVIDWCCVELWCGRVGGGVMGLGDVVID